MGRVLRVGLVLGGTLIEERLVRHGEAVTIGQSAKNTFSVPSPELPRKWRVLERASGGRGWALRVGAGMDGRVSDGDRADTQVVRGGSVSLSEQARGKVVAGDVTLLFQFVDPPKPVPRPQLPRSMRTTLADRIDPRIALIAMLSLLVHGGISLWVYRMDMPKAAAAEPEPERAVIVLRGPIMPPKPERKPEPKQSEGTGDKPAAPVASSPKSFTSTVVAAKPEKPISEDDAKGIFQATSHQTKFEQVAKVPVGSVRDALRDARQAALDADKHDGTRHGGDGPDVRDHVVDPNDVRDTHDPGNPDKRELDPTLVPKVETKKPDVIETDGDLSADTVFAKIQSNYQRELTRCYETAIKTDSGLKGAVVLTIAIDRDGMVRAATADGNMSEVNRCVARRARNWTFEDPEHGKGTFAFTFSFTASKR